MSRGSIPLGSYSTDLTDACKSLEAMSFDHSTSSAHPAGKDPVPVPKATDIGRKRTRQFLEDVLETPKKRTRLDIVHETEMMEKERVRVLNRLSKRKNKVKELMSEIQTDETRLAELDEQIRKLKSEKVE